MPKSAENLCVDLDGTLIRSDSLWELILRALRHNPFYLLLTPILLIKGKCFLKRRLSEKFGKFIKNLPFNSNVISYIKKRKKSGSKIWLVTACDEQIAKSIAEKTGLFDGIHGSSENINLKGEKKAAFCESTFGTGNFDYIGDSLADMPVWRKSSTPIIVGGKDFADKIQNKLGKEAILIESGAEISLKNTLKAARIYQWVKNTLIFVALISSHRYFILGDVKNSIMAFFAFCFCASALYILNDLLDIEPDRAHPTKRNRPFASGALPIPFGFSLMAIFAFASICVCTNLPRDFAIIVFAYAAITMGYSFAFKRIAFIDVAVLAGLYYMRIFGGCIVIDCKISYWLSLFSIFIFLGLALLKRYIELSESSLTAKARGYGQNHLSIVKFTGMASCAVSLLVFAIYTQRGAKIYYEYPSMLLLGIIPIGYFLYKIWKDASLRLVDSDPIVYSFRKKSNYALMALFAAIFALAKPF